MEKYNIGFSNLLEGELSHNQITRFLNCSEYGSKDLYEQAKYILQ